MQSTLDVLPGEGEPVAPSLTFHRLVTPLPDGHVRVQVVVRQAGRSLGRIVRARGGWRFQAWGQVTGRALAGRTEGLGEVCRTVEEVKKRLVRDGAKEGTIQ